MHIPHSSGLLLGVFVFLASVFTIPFLSGHHLAIEASELTQNWDRKLPSASRFTALSDFGGAAVRDEETGLVWETTLETIEMSWTDARAACADKDVGGRKGWRLPSVSELSSLLDPTARVRPTLPLGHPFANVQDAYWSATTVTDNTKNAWMVFFDTGKVLYAFKTITFNVWCVRNGTTADQY